MPRSAGGFTEKERKQARRLLWVLGLVGSFFVLELAGALVARSVVLQADALHLLMDVLALGMSLVAMRIAVRKPTERFTFGMRRAEPVAAIFNAMLVLTATAEIVHEAVVNLTRNAEPRADIMLAVACAALVVNGVSAWLLHDALRHDHAHEEGHGHAHAHSHEGSHGHSHGAGKRHRAKHSGHALNLRGAWLHLLGDTLGSVAALVAAIVIRAGGNASVDPLASFLVAAILVLGAMRLVRDAVLVLLEAAPSHLPVGAVREVILAGETGIVDVHDMHVWTLGAGHDAISVHVRARQADASLAERISRRLRDGFGVEYVTVQVEIAGGQCDAPPSLLQT